MQTAAESEFVKIAVLDNAIEAQLITSILNQRNIPHRLRSYHDTAYDGLFQVQMGWGELCAPLASQQEILDVLQDVRLNNFSYDDSIL